MRFFSTLSATCGIFLPAVFLMIAAENPLQANAAYLADIPLSQNEHFNTGVPQTHHLFTRAVLPVPGEVIERCIRPDMVALTFDDGPGINNQEIVKTLNELGVKGSFMVNGVNAADLRTNEAKNLLRYAYNSGHQICSHTYSHADLSTLNESQITKEMVNADNLIKAAIGKRPVYMRPPYGNTSPAMLKTMKKLGYYVVNWSIDTNDWRHPDDTNASIREFKEQFNESPTSSFISLAHDIQPGTNARFVREVVAFLRANNKRIVRLDECVGAPAYRA